MYRSQFEERPILVFAFNGELVGIARDNGETRWTCRLPGAGGAVDFVFSLYRERPGAFGYRPRPFEPLEAKHRRRWAEFRTAADRLNHPGLIHYFIFKDFLPEVVDPGSPEETFRRRAGDSCALARLGERLLEQAGYPAFFRRVETPGSPCEKVHCGAGIASADGRFILVVDFPKGKAITGPFDAKTLDRRLSEGNCLPPPARRPSVPLPPPVRRPEAGRAL